MIHQDSFSTDSRTNYTRSSQCLPSTTPVINAAGRLGSDVNCNLHMPTANPLNDVNTPPTVSRHQTSLESPLLGKGGPPPPRAFITAGAQFLSSHVFAPAAAVTKFLSSRLLVKLSDNEATLIFCLAGMAYMMTLCCLVTEVCVIVASFHTYASYVALVSLVAGRPIAGWIVSCVVNPAEKFTKSGEKAAKVDRIDAISDGIVVVLILFVSGIFFSLCGELLVEYWRLKECWRERHVNKLHKQLRLLQSRQKGVASATSRHALEQQTLLLLRQQQKAKAAVVATMERDKGEGCCSALVSFSPFTDSDDVIPQSEEEVAEKIYTIRNDRLFSFASSNMKIVFGFYCVCKCLFRLPLSALSLSEATMHLSLGSNGTSVVASHSSAEIILFTNGTVEALAVVLGLVVMIHKFIVDNSNDDSHVDDEGNSVKVQLFPISATVSPPISLDVHVANNNNKAAPMAVHQDCSDDDDIL